MKIAVISDVTYRATLPDDPNALGYYGSEQYHAVVASILSNRGHDVHFFAPSGSTEIGVGTFHPLELRFGGSQLRDALDDDSLERLKYTYLLDFDFIIDMSSHCRNIEMLNFYHGFKRYCCYRNGYAAIHAPRVPLQDRHYVVPSQQNAELFSQIGFKDARVIKYGIPEFYSEGRDQEYWRPFSMLQDKEYYIFPHRPTPEKGTEIVLRLAKDFPQETFVFAGHTPITEHVMARTELQRIVASQRLENVKFVDIPLNPKHHFYKRELYRQAKACLAPFIYPQYKEGFGLSSAEAVACGTPLIITDSPSTRELWIENVDALFCDGYQSFKLYIEHFSSYPLAPTNKFSVEEYGKNYEKLAMHQTLEIES